MFVQNIPGSHKSEKLIKITGIDKIHSKCDCIIGRFVNGVREPIFFSFALNKPPGHKFHREPRVKLSKKNKQTVLSHITFYLKDDGHIPVNLYCETISFTCYKIIN